MTEATEGAPPQDGAPQDVLDRVLTVMNTIGSAWIFVLMVMIDTDGREDAYEFQVRTVATRLGVEYEVIWPFLPGVQTFTIKVTGSIFRTRVDVTGLPAPKARV